jgi:hypothetical protein
VRKALLTLIVDDLDGHIAEFNKRGQSSVTHLTPAQQGAAPDRLQPALWSQAPVASASGGG